MQTQNQNTDSNENANGNPKHPDFPHFPLNFLKNSTRSDGRIASLEPEDQAQIIHWFALGHTYAKIIELAAQPRPDGLDLRLSLGVLHRFYHKHNLAEKIANAAQLVTEICPENAPDVEAACRILAQTHVLHTMGGPDLNHAAFQQITRFLLRQEDQRIRQRALDIKEKKIAFDMQHKHYDIFKRTVEKLPEINEIIRNKSLMPEQKFREHWIKTFGIDTLEMIERANKKWAETHPEQQHIAPDYSDDDVIPPLTPEEKQAAVTEAIRVMMGRGSAADDDNNALPTKPYKGIAHHSDTADQTFPL